jgi:hypothetical protein
VPNAHLQYPPAVTDPLRQRTRQEQMWMSAWLTSASRLLMQHPDKGVLCMETDGCLPLKPGSPLCPLCAVDASVNRHCVGFTESTIREFFAVGTVCKQALINLMEANPHACTETYAAALFTRELASRLRDGIIHQETPDA